MTRSTAQEPRWPYEPWLGEDRRDPEVGRPHAIMPAQIWHSVRTRGWILGLTVLCCLAAGVLFHLKSKPRFESTAQIIVDPRELQGVAGSATPRNETADSTEAAVGNEMRVLKSSTLLNALIDKEDLLHDPMFAVKPSPVVQLRGLLDETLGHPRMVEDTGDARLSVLDALDDMIAVRRTERSFAVDVSVRSPDADKSARLANSLVDLYVKQSSDAATELNRRVGLALQNRLTELQQRVRDADQRVEQYRTDHNLIAAGGVLTSDQRLRSLTDQLTLAQTREDEDRAKLDEIQHLASSADMAAVAEAVQSPAVAQLRAQLADAIRRRAGLSPQLGPRHPELKSSDEQVLTAQRLLNQELRRVAQTARNQYARSHGAVVSLQKSVDSLSRSSLDNGSAVAHLRELEQEADAARALFTSFQSRSRELSEQSWIYANNVRQISTALPALHSSGIPLSIVLVFCLVVGLLLGTLIAALLDLRTPRSGVPGDGRRSYSA